MIYIFIPIIILLIIVINYKLSKSMKSKVERKYLLSDEEKIDDFPEIMPYESKGSYLSTDERILYEALKFILKDRDYRIESKAKLSDFIMVKHHKKRQYFYDRIKNKTVDFLICHDDSNFKPLVGVNLLYNLEGNSEEEKKINFIEGVFKNAELPLIKLHAKRKYEDEDLEELINKLEVLD